MFSGNHMKHAFRVAVTCLVLLAACEDTNLQLATEAGIEAVRAITLSDGEVQQLARSASREMDAAHRVAPEGSPYAQRLQRLVGAHRERDGYAFGYKVYLSPEINAFAMADGTIRIYSGLMDRMNDGELRFVIGHEMGHVVKEHSRKKMVLALAGSAVRKGIASQENIVGDVVRSGLGTFLELFVNAQYSQEEERAADDYALKFMTEEGYNPERAVSALEKLARPGTAPTLLSSHPAAEDRAERIRQRLKNPEKKIENEGIVARALDFLQAVVEWIAALVTKIAGLLD